jgi:hypothetical protein
MREEELAIGMRVLPAVFVVVLRVLCPVEQHISEVKRIDPNAFTKGILVGRMAIQSISGIAVLSLTLPKIKHGYMRRVQGI